MGFGVGWFLGRRRRPLHWIWLKIITVVYLSINFDIFKKFWVGEAWLKKIEGKNRSKNDPFFDGILVFLRKIFYVLICSNPKYQSISRMGSSYKMWYWVNPQLLR